MSEIILWEIGVNATQYTGSDLEWDVLCICNRRLGFPWVFQRACPSFGLSSNPVALVAEFLFVTPYVVPSDVSHPVAAHSPRGANWGDWASAGCLHRESAQVNVNRFGVCRQVERAPTESGWPLGELAGISEPRPAAASYMVTRPAAEAEVVCRRWSPLRGEPVTFTLVFYSNIRSTSDLKGNNYLFYKSIGF